MMSWLKKQATKLITKSLGNVYSDGTFFNFARNLGTKFAGKEVTYTSAMQQTDVYTCIRIKAEAMGQLPIKLYRTDKENVRRRIYGGREHKIFTKRPNAFQTWQDFIEVYVTVMEIQGNFYAEVKRNRYGSVYEIVPMRYQGNVSVQQDNYGNVYYVYATNDGKGKIERATYAARDILHIKLNSTDGLTGMSPIRQAARDIGLAIAGNDAAAALFENGNTPAGVLSTDQTFGEDDASVDRLRKSWEKTHAGSSNKGKVAILEAGLKYQSIQMSSVDAQLLEMMGLSRERIAALFRIPSHMLNAKEGMKYNTVEHNNTGFFRDALMPLVTKLENGISPLLPENHDISLDEKTFVRGDREAQVKTVSEEIKSGICSLNEGRIDLGREPIDGGDVFAIQTNNLQFGSYDDIARYRELNLKKLENEANGTANQPQNQPNQNNPDNVEPEENQE